MGWRRVLHDRLAVRHHRVAVDLDRREETGTRAGGDDDRFSLDLLAAHGQRVRGDERREPIDVLDAVSLEQRRHSPGESIHDLAAAFERDGVVGLDRASGDPV